MKHFLFSVVVLAGLFSCTNTKTDNTLSGVVVRDSLSNVEDSACLCHLEEDSLYVETDSVAPQK